MVSGCMPGEQHGQGFYKEGKVVLEQDDVGTFVRVVPVLLPVSNLEVIVHIFCFFDVEKILARIVAKSLCIQDVGKHCFFVFHFLSVCFDKVAGRFAFKKGFKRVQTFLIVSYLPLKYFPRFIFVTRRY